MVAKTPKQLSTTSPLYGSSRAEEAVQHATSSFLAIDTSEEDQQAIERYDWAEVSGEISPQTKPAGSIMWIEEDTLGPVGIKELARN
jgi:hypothetical protein